MLGLLFHGFTACLTLLFFFQQGFLVRTQGGGTTGLFIALSLFFLADDRLRYGRSGRFGCFFRFFAFAAFVLFGFGRFFGFDWFFSFNGFFRRLVVCFRFNFCFGLGFYGFNRFGFFFFGFGRFAFCFWCGFGCFQSGSFGFCFGAGFGFCGSFCFSFGFFFGGLSGYFFCFGFLVFRCYFGFGFRCQFFGRRNGNGTAAAACFHFYAVNCADFGFFTADADGAAVAAVFLLQVSSQQLFVVSGYAVIAAVFVDPGFFQLFKQIIDGAV